MLVLIDNAQIEKIRKLYDRFPIDGVTTNPTILKAAGKNPLAVLKEIRSFLPKEAQLHAQLVCEDAEKMVAEAHFLLKELGDDLYIKVPITKEGLRAVMRLCKEGVRVTGTAIYTPMQAFAAGKAGARYVAPYVNRIDNLGADGVKAAKEIHDMFQIHGITCGVLAASFKNSQQVLALCKHGIEAVTAAPDVLDGLLAHDAVEPAVAKFNSDYTALLKDVTGLHLK